MMRALMLAAVLLLSGCSTAANRNDLDDCMMLLAVLSDDLDPLLYEPARPGDLARCRAAVRSLLRAAV